MAERRPRDEGAYLDAGGGGGGQGACLGHGLDAGWDGSGDWAWGRCPLGGGGGGGHGSDPLVPSPPLGPESAGLVAPDWSVARLALDTPVSTGAPELAVPAASAPAVPASAGVVVSDVSSTEASVGGSGGPSAFSEPVGPCWDATKIGGTDFTPCSWTGLP